MSHGALMDGAAFAAGKEGQAFSLDGSRADTFSVPSSPVWAFETGDFTLALWANLATVEVEQSLLASGGGSDDGNRWSFQFARGHLQIASGGRKQTNDPRLAPRGLRAGAWHHFAVTRSGHLIRFFVDGVGASSRAWSDRFPTTKGPLFLGHQEGGSYLHGLLDDIRIYHRALSDEELHGLVDPSAKSLCRRAAPPFPLPRAARRHRLPPSTQAPLFSNPTRRI